MPNHIVLGNGNILIGMDEYAQIRDFFYPYVGQENHVQGHRHKIGVYVDKQFSWTFDKESWNNSLCYEKDTLVANIVMHNPSLNISMVMNDTVHHNKDIYLKECTIFNKSSKSREIRIFFNQHFNIAGANIGDTAYYDPKVNAIIYYKGKRYFFISGSCNNESFKDYATGIADFQGKEGTFRDAEDGELSKNPIEHGSVDSTIGFKLKIPAHGQGTIYYWITVGRRYHEVKFLHDFILKHTPEELFEQSRQYWKSWVNKHQFHFYNLTDEVVDFFKRSLLTIKTQIDNRGAILASTDSGLLQFNKDTYSYMWPRDGAFIAMTLSKAGYIDPPRKFFNFCKEVLTEGGYLLHKYRPDKSVGSSWHPWIKNNKQQLPIQEDETALVLYALWKHFEYHNDLEYIETLYHPLIRKMADFLYEFRDQNTKLPIPTYDLWEEKFGVSTFTAASVYAGLVSAKKFAEVFGDVDVEKKYDKASREIKEAILKYLYDEEKKYFIKSILVDKEVIKDYTIDISNLYGILEFGVLDYDDHRVKNTLEVIQDKLVIKNEIGGVARYEGDKYFRNYEDANIPGNPWFICTLWLAKYHILCAKKMNDFQPLFKALQWVIKNAMPTGLLAEQIDPLTGKNLSVVPLTWSHSSYVLTVLDYLEKAEELGLCQRCGPRKQKLK